MMNAIQGVTSSMNFIDMLLKSKKNWNRVCNLGSRLFRITSENYVDLVPLLLFGSTERPSKKRLCLDTHAMELS